MSDQSMQLRSAQTIRFGLLAARSSSAIERAIAHLELSAEEQAILLSAEEFLRQVADGAAFVSTGAQTGGGALRTTEALGYALNPIESLGLFEDRGVPDTFNSFAAAVHEIAAGNVARVDPDMVSGIKVFFDRLYMSLRSLIEHNRLRPADGSRSAMLGHYA